MARKYDRRGSEAAHRADTLSVSNSSSLGGDGELNQVPTVGDPAHLDEIRRLWRQVAGERQRRVAVQRRVGACGVVVTLELGQLPFQIAGVPERDMVEKFSADRPD